MMMMMMMMMILMRKRRRKKRKREMTRANERISQKSLSSFEKNSSVWSFNQTDVSNTKRKISLKRLHFFIKHP